MTTRTRTTIRTKWIAGTRMSRIAAPLPVVNKPYTVDETTATLATWLNAYGYLVAKQGGENWLRGLVPADQIERVAQKVREQLRNAQPSTAGKALALMA